MNITELHLLIELGLVELTGKTVDGAVKEYRLTGNGRIMARATVGEAKPRARAPRRPRTVRSGQ